MTLSPDRMREYQREWKNRRRREWIEENGPCIDCGSLEDLEIDHRDASTKLHNVSSLWSLSPVNPKRVEELAKCVVRCKSCHLQKTVLNHERSHGSSHFHAKLTEEDILSIRGLHLSGQPKRSIAREFNVDEKMIRLIVANQAWTHV